MLKLLPFLEMLIFILYLYYKNNSEKNSEIWVYERQKKTERNKDC